MSKFVVDDGCRCAVGICTERILTMLSYLLSNRSIRTEQRLFQLRRSCRVSCIELEIKQ